MIKKKKVMSLFWAFALFLTILPLSEKKVYAATSGDWGYEVIDGTDEVAITEYKGNATSVEIPQNLGGKKVTRIASFAFHDAGNLTSITIPNTITIIEDQAFYRCSSLTNITIPNSVTEIWDWAFMGCSSLKSITIPKNITTLGTSILASCSSLESITVQSGNAKYDSRNNCNAIIETKTNTLVAGCKNTIIPNDVESIGYGAFEGCSLESIRIPNSVKSIKLNAFSACNNLKNITIPNNVESIDGYTFNNCSNLESITLPNRITGIGAATFSGCSSLKNITIPNSVQRIGYSAFYGCSSLESITIPDGVKSIEMSTFYGCSGLKSIIIPDSVTNIVNSAFQDCTVVVYCSRGSYAEEYAKKKGLSVKYMSNQKVSVSTPSAFKQSSATTNNIKLTWKKGDGVSYEVYRSNKKNGSYKKIATVSTNSYTDKKLKAGTAYYYKVRAIKTVSKKTYKSSDSSILKAVTKPEKAKVTLKAGKKQIKISWKKVTGAEKQEVYLSTSKKGKYEKLTTTKNTKYTAKKLKKGKTYYITVRSYITDGSGKKYYSAYSSVKSVKVK